MAVHDLESHGDTPRRRGRIDSIPELANFDLSPLAEGKAHGRSAYVGRGFTGPAAFYRDLVAEALRDASRALSGIHGATTPEDVLDRIFARFCLGK